MSLYPSDHEITVDELREIVYDDNIDAEIFGDDRYETWIDRYPGDWRSAALAALDRMIGEVAGRPNRLASDGESIGWSDKRITALEAQRAAIAADLAADGLFGIVTVSQEFLTRCPEGDAAWS